MAATILMIQEESQCASCPVAHLLGLLELGDAGVDRLHLLPQGLELRLQLVVLLPSTTRKVSPWMLHQHTMGQER
jgi:hypothetical protein